MANQLTLFESLPKTHKVEIVDDEPFFEYSGFLTDLQRNPLLTTEHKSIKLFREMLEQDDRLSGDFWKFKNLVLSTQWHIKAQSDKRSAKKRAEFIQKNLENLAIPIKESLSSLMDSMIYGYAICEKVFRLVNGKYEIDYIKPKEATNIEFKTDQYRNLQYVLNNPNLPNEQKINPAKLIIGVYPNPYGYNRYYGESILTPIFEWYNLKKRIRKWLAMSIELNLDPPTIIKINKNLPKEQRDSLKVLLNQIKSFRTTLIGFDVQKISGSGTETQNIVSDAIIEKLETKTSKEIWDYINKLISDIDTRISRLFAIPEDLTGNNKEGSYARAKEQFDYIIILTTVVQQWIENLINIQLIKQLEYINFDKREIEKNGNSLFVFQEDERFTKEKADALKVLKEAGVELNKDWLYNEFLFIPEPTIEEEKQIEEDELIQQEQTQALLDQKELDQETMIDNTEEGESNGINSR